ncbi:DUF952 domain-containing protein [Nonomuraea sp. NPDC059023]|uniref:DUF952 domain-containing protein n=1 Tax=unclassified Nonomuraea TaxID=2593643 RepID=UPI0036C65618
MILHLALAADWHATGPAGYQVSTLGKTLQEVGFIHCSHDHTQLDQVANTFYAAVTEPLLVLHIDPTGLDVREEDGFPHLYGPLPTASVTATHPYSPVRPA